MNNLRFFSDLQPVVKQHIFHFSMYDFLWKDDMQGNYTDFIKHDPGTPSIQREVSYSLVSDFFVLYISWFSSPWPVAIADPPPASVFLQPPHPVYFIQSTIFMHIIMVSSKAYR